MLYLIYFLFLMYMSFSSQEAYFYIWNQKKQDQ